MRFFCVFFRFICVVQNAFYTPNQPPIMLEKSHLSLDFLYDFGVWIAAGQKDIV